MWGSLEDLVPASRAFEERCGSGSSDSQSLAIDTGQNDFAGVSRALELVLHLLNDSLRSPLEEYKDGRARAAEGAAQQSRGAQFQNIAKAGNRRQSVRLVKPIFERNWKGLPIARRQSRDQQCRPLKVEDRILFRIAIRQERTHLVRGQREVGTNDGDPEVLGQIKAHTHA